MIDIPPPKKIKTLSLFSIPEVTCAILVYINERICCVTQSSHCVSQQTLRRHRFSPIISLKLSPVPYCRSLAGPAPLPRSSVPPPSSLTQRRPSGPEHLDHQSLGNLALVFPMGGPAVFPPTLGGGRYLYLITVFREKVPTP